MANVIEEIKERLDIADVVGSYIKLERAGKNLKAKCPFHNEKTPSFFVSPERGTFYCFGCQASGDIFSFIEKIEGVDFKSALRLLAEKAGINLSEHQTNQNKFLRDENERLRYCLEKAASYFEGKLSESIEALSYLKSRGLKEETIKEWRLGLAPAGWRNLLEYLRSVGFSEKEMLLAGLIKEKGEDNRFYDIFRHRIMFPIFDSVGRVIAFSGRTLDSSGNEAKYINSPETPIFKKAEVLYGFHLAKFGIRKMDFAMIVEGQMDLLMSHQSGFINTVATSGTALSEEHLKKIRRITDNLVVAFDLDKAGIQATKRALDLVLKFGFNVKIANLMNSKDPADLAKDNLSDFKKAIKESEDAVSFFWRVSKIEEIEKDKRYKIFKKEILPLLARLDNFAERSRLISKHKMSLVLGIREDFLWEEIKKMENILRDEEKGNLHNGETVSVENDYKSTNTPLNIAITKLAGYLQRWNNKEDSLILNAQQKIQNTIGIEEFNRRLEMDKNELSRAVMEVELLGDDKILLEKYLKDLLYNFEMEWLKEQMTLCLNELSLAEKMENRSRVDEMLKKCQNVSSRINQLTKEKEL